MSSFNETVALFPSFPYSTSIILARIYLALENISFKFVTAEFYISIFGLFLTIFHLIILTRKSMMTSSIISIMISTAICDLSSMIESIGSRDVILSFAETSECSPPLTLFTFRVFSAAQSFRDDVIRCSTWLSVLMALVRVLMLKLATSRKNLRISTVKFGFQGFGATFLISTAFSNLHFLRAKIVQIGEWMPGEQCANIPSTALPVYEALLSDHFSAHNQIVQRTFMFINGITSKILPCLLFPVLTGLLILELRKARQSRRNSSMVSARNERSTERTTGLVIFMTVSAFIALLPTGIMTSLRAVFTDIGFTYMSTCVELICFALLTLNASLHCFICFAMSSQYRKTVWALLRISKANH